MSKIMSAKSLLHDLTLNRDLCKEDVELLDWLIEQAERVQELERKYEERENELIRILTNRYKYITQLENTEIILSEKIKHYREVFEKLYKFDGNVEEHSALAYMLCGELLHVETLESEK